MSRKSRQLTFPFIHDSSSFAKRGGPTKNDERSEESSLPLPVLPALEALQPGSSISTSQCMRAKPPRQWRSVRNRLTVAVWCFTESNGRCKECREMILTAKRY